jgi:outer membrane protein, adhesin transport system
MKRIPLKLRIVFFLIVTHASAQEAYNLQDFIAVGLENNYSLQIARNRAEISVNNYTPGNAGFLPSLDLSGRHSGSTTDTRKNLSDGSEDRIPGSLNTTTSAGVNLGWTLFDGFRVQTTWKKLGELQAQGELNTRIAVENFISNIVSEYYFYIQQTQLLKNLQYAVSLSKERTRIDEERYLIGSGSKLQLLQSQVFLNADSSRLSRQHEVVRASLIRLNELIAAEDLNNLSGVTDTIIDVNPDLIYEELLDLALIDNTSLLIAASNQVIAEYDKKLTQSRSYPYLNLGSGYAYTFNTFQESTVKTQYSLGMNYSITFGVPIFDGFNRRREIQNARIEILNRELQYRQVEQEMKADLLTIYNAYTSNLRLLSFELQNLETARENLEIGIERYRLGVLSGLELREVQKSLLEAEERILAVQYQTKLAELSLLQIAGKIMDYI